MPNPNINFNGSTLILPGAYSGDNVSNALTPTPPTTPPLIFLGNFYGQKPYTPFTYTTPADVKNAIRGGPASGYVPFLTAPSPQLNGAQLVTLINCSNATQSTLALSNSGATTSITLTSVNYGLPSNLLQAQVVAGTLGGKKVSLYDGYAGTLVVGDNLGVPFELAYAGAATGVTYSVTSSGGSGVTLTTSSSVSAESLSINLTAAGYATVEQVVQYLNGTGYYTAAVLSNGLLPSIQLNAASAVALAVPVSGAPQFVQVASTLGDVVYWINNLASGLATAVQNLTNIASTAPSNAPFTFFSGATSPAATQSDYASGFNAALAIPGWAVFCDSTASGTVALGTQHAVTASTTANGAFRRFFTGSPTGQSVANATIAAQAANSNTTCYVYPGIYRNDPTSGVNTLYSGLYAAAAVAGMATGNPPATPLTNKALTGTGIEVALTQSQINQLQQAGVMVVQQSFNTNVPTIVSDMTTYQMDSNPENIFTQQIACRWFLAYTMINALQPYAGSIASALDEARILNAAKAALNNSVYGPNNAIGVISSWAANSLSLVYTGANQTAALTVNVTLVGQNRFVTMLVNVQPLSVTFNSATQG